MTLFPKTIPYISRTGSYVSGRWQNTDTPGTFTGSVQPLTGKEIEALPIARRDVGSVKIYSSTPLQVSVQGGDTPGDLVLWWGRRWEVVAELANQNDLIPHFKYIAQDAGAA